MSNISNSALHERVNVHAIIDTIRSNWEEFKEYCWYGPSAEETLEALEELNDCYIP